MVCKMMSQVSRLHVDGCVVKSRRTVANRIDLCWTAFHAIEVDKLLLQH
jgi:hypothetical protein